MKVFPVKAENGQEIAFEIENVYVTPKKIAHLLNDLPEVHDVHIGKLFRSSDERVAFKYLDKDFVVWEPYGDSSRYWIGPKDSTDLKIDLKELKDAFLNYKPNLIIRIIGNVLTLNFLKCKDKQAN